jgi:hypothetical protein
MRNAVSSKQRFHATVHFFLATGQAISISVFGSTSRYLAISM